MASKNVLFVGWNRPVFGREGDAMELFQIWTGYLEQRKGSGDIDSWTPVMLNAHGGELNGFFLIHGDINKITKLRNTDEWKDLTTKAKWNLQQFGVIDGITGEGIKEQMGRFQKLLK